MKVNAEIRELNKNSNNYYYLRRSELKHFWFDVQLEGYSKNEKEAIKILMTDNGKNIDEAIEIVEVLSKFIN